VFRLAARFIAQKGARGGWSPDSIRRQKTYRREVQDAGDFLQSLSMRASTPKAFGRQARVHRAGRQGLTTGFRDEIEASRRSGMAVGSFHNAGGSCGKRGQSKSDDDHLCIMSSHLSMVCSIGSVSVMRGSGMRRCFHREGIIFCLQVSQQLSVPSRMLVWFCLGDEYGLRFRSMTGSTTLPEGLQNVPHLTSAQTLDGRQDVFGGSMLI